MQNKTNQIVPEFTVDLKGATICWATKDKSSKKNVLEVCGRIKLQIQEGSHLFWTQTQFLSTCLMKCVSLSPPQLKTKNAVEFLIQYDTESIIVDWHRVLTDTIRQLVRSCSCEKRSHSEHLLTAN